MLQFSTLLIVKCVKQHKMSVDRVALIELLTKRCNSAPDLPSYEPRKKNQLKCYHKLNIVYLEQHSLNNLSYDGTPMRPEHLSTQIELLTLSQYKFIDQFVDELSNFNGLIEIH